MHPFYIILKPSNAYNNDDEDYMRAYQLTSSTRAPISPPCTFDEFAPASKLASPSPFLRF